MDDSAWPPIRTASFGQDWSPTLVDRLGIWLSRRKVQRYSGGAAGKRVGDFGCGYHATLARSLSPAAASVVVVDVSVDAAIKTQGNIQVVEGALPGILESIDSQSLDLLLCVSVLEHLRDAPQALSEFRRILAPGGVALLNVPSWRGKRFLELSAFRFHLSPPEEMDDHKRYYDPRDLWPLLVDAGFMPRNIRCFRHKLGLNTFAVCRAPSES